MSAQGHLSRTGVASSHSRGVPKISVQLQFSGYATPENSKDIFDKFELVFGPPDQDNVASNYEKITQTHFMASVLNVFRKLDADGRSKLQEVEGKESVYLFVVTGDEWFLQSGLLLSLNDDTINIEVLV